MHGPKPPEVSLSEAERQGLKTLLRRHTTPQQLSQRVRIIAAADGNTKSQIARQLPMDVDTVRLWRIRWLGRQAASLDDVRVSDRLSALPAPGTQPR